VASGDGPTTGSTDLFLGHAIVVGSLLGSCRSVVPARAGSSVADEEAVRRLLADRADELREALERVAGRVELAVRCEPGLAAPSVPAADGRGYLQDRVRRWQWADAAAGRFAAMQDTAGVREIRLLSHRPDSVKASLLVEQPMAESVRGAVRRAVRDLSGSLSCTGPYPPYSFVSPPPTKAAA
jgi:hypothetical protein